jgi:DNA recombination protein RmuC
MDLTPLVLTALVAMLVGAVVGWLAGRARVGALDARLQERDTQLGQAANRLEAHDAQLAAARAEQTRLATEVTRLEGEVATERRLLAEKERLLEQFDQRLREAFRATSQEVVATGTQQLVELATARFDVLTEQAKAELEQRRTSIDGLVQPMQEKLGEVHRALETVNVERAKSQEALEQQLRMLTDQGLQLAGETRNLVTALRAPQARGAWGEMQLRRVVELAGMQAHVDFVEQDHVPTADGALRPDLVVHLPGRKKLIVDAKTPLTAYVDALGAVDEREALLHLDRHAKAIRTHIEQLSAKNYADQYAESPDFVVMFIPGEAFFGAACQRDPGLIEFAVQKGVIPTSPTSCITVLKAVAYGWQQERLAANLEEIRDLGIELYDRMAMVAEHFAGVGRGLKGAVEAYDRTIGSRETRVLPTARKLKAKGAGGRKEIEGMEPLHVEPRPMVSAELRQLHQSAAIALQSTSSGVADRQ